MVGLQGKEALRVHGVWKGRGRWGAGKTRMIPKSTLMTFDGWFVEKGKSIRECVSLPCKQRSLQHSDRPRVQIPAIARGWGCGGASTIFGILRHNSLIGDPPPIHPIPQPQDLHGSLRQGGAKVRQKQKQPMFSSTRRIDINAFQIWNVSGNSRELGILESGSELAGRIWGIMTNREQQDKSCKSQCDFCSGDSFTACPEANLGGVFMSCHASPRP